MKIGLSCVFDREEKSPSKLNPAETQLVSAFKKILYQDPDDDLPLDASIAKKRRQLEEMIAKKHTKPLNKNWTRSGDQTNRRCMVELGK